MSDGPRFDPDYLGAGVYVAHDNTQLWIRANNARWGEPGAEVRLEPEVLAKLFSYATVRGLIARPQ